MNRLALGKDDFSCDDVFVFLNEQQCVPLLDRSDTYPRLELLPLGSSLDFRLLVLFVELDGGDEDRSLMLFCW